MRQRRPILGMAAACLVLAAVPSPARATDPPATPAAVDRGRVDVVSDPYTPAPDQDPVSRVMTIAVERSRDGTMIRGPVKVTGASHLPQGALGNVDWRVDGSDLSGAVEADDGRILVRFDGKVSMDGASGTYRAADGTEGTWSWEGPVGR